MSSTSAVDRDTKETVIDTEIRAIRANAEENFEIFLKHSATHRRLNASIANSRSLRRQQTDEKELKSLRAKKEAEQRLEKQQLEFDQEREEIQLRRRKEELQQQEEELRFRQHEWELENERKKAEADKEQRRMEIELTKGISRASGLQAEVLESVV